LISRSIAKRYARGLFSTGEKDGRYRDYLKEIEGILDFLNRKERLQRVLMLPIIEMEKRKELLKDLLKAFSVSPPVANLMTMVLEKNRMNHLPLIKEVYEELVDEKEGRVKGVIWSPYPIKKEVKERIEGILRGRLNKEVVFDCLEDKGLIGGIKVIIKGTIMDGSVKRQLEIMKENIFKE
jgi:F-type H+-transporting ATPase subunit delta